MCRYYYGHSHYFGTIYWYLCHNFAKIFNKKKQTRIARVFRKITQIYNSPIIFNKFIDSIINKDEFKNKFLTLIETEIENMLETRETFTQKGDNTIRDKFLKKQEEQGNG